MVKISDLRTVDTGTDWDYEWLCIACERQGVFTLSEKIDFSSELRCLYCNEVEVILEPKTTSESPIWFNPY